MDTDYIKINSRISICSQYGYGFYQNTFKDFYLFSIWIRILSKYIQVFLSVRRKFEFDLKLERFKISREKENPERIKVITDKAW